MKRTLLIILIFCSVISIKAQTISDEPALLSKRFVDLQGKEGMTIFNNSTSDTVNLKGSFFNWMPYTETTFSFKIAPGKQDTLKMQFNYPDFINVNHLRVYNGPGGKLICDIKQIKTLPADINYSGDFAQQNDYYLAYHNFLKNYDQESRPYYDAGDKIKDWNRFSAIADSITMIRLKFLDDYKGTIPSWFKQNEHQRLVYNGMLRKDNVLFSKEFYGGNKITVKERYFDYQKQINLVNSGMLLNTEYLWVTDAYLNRIARQVAKAPADPVIYAIDSICHVNKVADLLKMRRLFILYTSAKDKFEAAFNNTRFADTLYKNLIDSLIQVKLGLPKVGKAAPGFSLIDMDGKTVSLADYKEKTIILNYWASWCGACIRKFPEENRLYRQYKDKGLVVINICIDSKIETWKRISTEKQLQMINLFCTAADYKMLKSKYNLNALPRSILISKEGKVLNNYFNTAGLLTDKNVNAILK
jgi:peroxiredoxin